MKKTAKGKLKIDWSRVDAMTESQRHAAAMADPDARPMTDAEWARAPRVPQVSVIRGIRIAQACREAAGWAVNAAAAPSDRSAVSRFGIV